MLQHRLSLSKRRCLQVEEEEEQGCQECWGDLLSHIHHRDQNHTQRISTHPSHLSNKNLLFLSNTQEESQLHHKPTRYQETYRAPNNVSEQRTSLGYSLKISLHITHIDQNHICHISTSSFLQFIQSQLCHWNTLGRCSIHHKPSFNWDLGLEVSVNEDGLRSFAFRRTTFFNYLSE